MIFLSSIPRSGSTLLTSLLNQRPDVYASPTSNLCDTMGAAVKAWEKNPITKASGAKEEDLIRILQGIQHSRYDTDKLVFDKSREWVAPRTIQTLGKWQDVKIIATVRPMADCLASFIKIAKPDNIRNFCKNSELAAHLFASYHALRIGYETYSDKFLLIEYDQLVSDTQTQMDRISTFVGMSVFTHKLNDVPDSKEEDKVWGIKNLHHVRKKVRKRRYSTKKILGEELYTHYQGGEFWNDKPSPVRGMDLLDFQLEASLHGNFEKSAQISEKLLSERPNCNRVKFNAGWHQLHKGNLQDGHKLLDCVRLIYGVPFKSSYSSSNGTIADIEGSQ